MLWPDNWQISCHCKREGPNQASRAHSTLRCYSTGVTAPLQTRHDDYLHHAELLAYAAAATAAAAAADCLCYLIRTPVHTLHITRQLHIMYYQQSSQTMAAQEGHHRRSAEGQHTRNFLLTFTHCQFPYGQSKSVEEGSCLFYHQVNRD
jgi:hypothetical protein